MKYKKNITGFVTAARPEYMSIKTGHYYYTEDKIWLTGLPRFDRLYDDQQRIITIMPTWRSYLTTAFSAVSGQRELDANFKNSSFYLFYYRLIRDARLAVAVSKHGYRIVLFPHPYFEPYMEELVQGSLAEYPGIEMSYRKIYAKSSLIVTDYSSAVFDFAYLRKPVIYTQFDVEEFFSGIHTYVKGYFDYEQDGFGEVEFDLESTVSRIIEYIEAGCKLKAKYRERIDKFFAFDDRNNCKRVLNEILAQDKGRRE